MSVLNVFATVDRLTHEASEDGMPAESGWVNSLNGTEIHENRNDVAPLFSCWILPNGTLYTPGDKRPAPEQDQELREELSDLIQELGSYETEDGSTLYADDAETHDYTSDSTYLYALHAHVKLGAERGYTEVDTDILAVAEFTPEWSPCELGKHSPAITDEGDSYITPAYCDVCGLEGPNVLHKYRTLRLTGAGYCETCDSPLCDLL